MGKKHYKLSPSSSSRWLVCTKSLELSEGCERRDTVYSIDGTEAHDLIENCLIYDRDAIDLCSDSDRVSAVQVYLDFVRKYRREKNPIVDATERKLKSLHIEDFGGTVDHTMIYEEDGKIVLHVFDYKHGAGVPVDAIENKQVLSYMSIVGSHYPGLIDLYRGSIIQPRCFKEEAIQTWECDQQRVDQHEDDVRGVSQRDDWVAGSHCQFCPAITKCKKVEEHALEVAKTEFGEIRSDVDRLLEIQRVAPAITTLINKIDSALLDQFKFGDGVPGHKVVRRWSHRRYTTKNQDELRKKFKSLRIPKRLYVEEKIKTPAQLEKELEDKKLLESITEKQVIGYKVVPDNSRGEAVDLSSANEFSEIENG